MGKTYKSNFDKGPKEIGNKARKKSNLLGREVIKKDKKVQTEGLNELFEEYDDGSNFEKFTRKR